MSDIAGKEFWNSFWNMLPPLRKYQGPVFEQHPALYPFLSKSQDGNAIEVGCVPGNWMIYLNKEYGYRVSGIDYSEYMDYVKTNMQLNGIEDYDLFNEDFLHFKPKGLYDLVFSAGFVEHFEDYEGVVKKHAEIARQNGLIVIIVPNLTHLHKYLCGIFQPDQLAKHRFPLMRKKVLKIVLENAGLEVLYCKYYKTFRPVYALPPLLSFISRAFQKLLRTIKLDNIGNRFGSPYLISISRKK